MDCPSDSTESSTSSWEFINDSENAKEKGKSSSVPSSNSSESDGISIISDCEEFHNLEQQEEEQQQQLQQQNKNEENEELLENENHVEDVLSDISNMYTEIEGKIYKNNDNEIMVDNLNRDLQIKEIITSTQTIEKYKENFSHLFNVGFLLILSAYVIPIAAVLLYDYYNNLPNDLTNENCPLITDDCMKKLFSEQNSIKYLTDASNLDYKNELEKKYPQKQDEKTFIFLKKASFKIDKNQYLLNKLTTNENMEDKNMSNEVTNSKIIKKVGSDNNFENKRNKRVMNKTKKENVLKTEESLKDDEKHNSNDIEIEKINLEEIKKKKKILNVDFSQNEKERRNFLKKLKKKQEKLNAKAEMLRKKEKYLEAKEKELNNLEKDLKEKSEKIKDILRKEEKKRHHHFKLDQKFSKEDKSNKNKNVTVSGEWYDQLHEARNKIRKEEHASDWLFELYNYRESKRKEKKKKYPWVNFHHRTQFK